MVEFRVLKDVVCLSVSLLLWAGLILLKMGSLHKVHAFSWILHVNTG